MTLLAAIIIAHTDLIVVAVVGVVYGIRYIVERRRGERDDRRKDRG